MFILQIILYHYLIKNKKSEYNETCTESFLLSHKEQ